MVVSDKEAYRVLGLPLGVHKDAICARYKQMSTKLANSKSAEDRRKAELVTAAYFQLIPPNQRVVLAQSNGKQNNQKNKASKVGQSQYLPTEAHYTSSSDEDVRGTKLQNGDNKNTDALKKSDKKKAKKKKKKAKKAKDKNETNGVQENDGRLDESESDDDIGVEAHMVDPTRQLQARQYAMLGNEEANKFDYDKAVELFTKAISLDPTDHRFFGNRSYCYDQLQLYDKALKDAEKAIRLSPEWPKGHFRKGRALKGLDKLTEADASFQKVLKFDEGCEDAIIEINNVRKRFLKEMGFSEGQARAALKKYINFQPALDALIAGEFKDESKNIMFSDDDYEEENVRPIQTQARDVKMNPRNLEGLTSLWVGNVVQEVSEKLLIRLFSKYGHVTSVRQLKEKYCAFVNYSDTVSAGRAMEALQGKDVCGSKLLIKFPDNPIANGPPNIILRKTRNSRATTDGCAQYGSSEDDESDIENKMKGPVNGNECYFWRTTGCAFNASCKYKHLPSSRGIDKKPWQKSEY